MSDGNDSTGSLQQYMLEQGIQTAQQLLPGIPRATLDHQGLV
jgi:hypothetical protein